MEKAKLAKKLTLRDRKKAKVQTTAEGRSWLRARFEYWMQKLK